MTHATVNEQPARQLPNELGRFVAGRVTSWQRDYLRRRPEALATLARLRRGVSKPVGAMPDLWQYTLDGLPGPETRSDAPTKAEQAVHTAMTLFATHQQSRSQEMHQPGQSLGTAVRRLQARAASADAVRRRFEALGTAETFTEVVHHARGLITQLRADGIPLDYGSLTQDLFRLQTGAADQVRLRWGRDFYRTDRNDDNSPDTDNPAAETAPTDEEAS